MVYSHTVLTAVIAIGAASTVGAAPVPPSANSMGVVGIPGPALPVHYVEKNVAPLPTRELDARELDIILEEEPHKHSHHHHHHHHHHFGGKHHHHDDEELEVHFEEDNPHYHHGEEEIEVEFKEEQRHPHFRHHGEEEEDFEVDFKEEHGHQHHHSEEEQHVYHHIHEHEHPIQAEHQKFNHPMGMPPKVEKDEFWIVEVEDHGHPIHMERRQDPDAGAAPAPADPSQTTPPPAQGGRLRNKFHQWQQSPGGQKVSAKLHNQLDKHFPVAGAGASASSASASAPPPPDAQFSRRSGSQIESSTDTGDGSNGSVAKNSQGQALASQEWKAIKTVHPKWRNDMDLSGGDWEKFLKTPTGEAVKEKGDTGLEAMVKQALKQHTASAQRAGNAPGSTVAGSSPATSPSGSSSTSNPSTAASSLARRVTPATAGAGSDESTGLTGDSSTGSPSMGSPGKSDALANNPSSPSSTTSSSGPSGLSEEEKHKYRKEWKEVKKISSFKEDMEASKGNFDELLKTPTGKAIKSKGEGFEKFVKAHHMKKHHRHHQNQNPESSIAGNGSDSAPSSAQSTTSATSSTNNSPSLEARFGFAAHNSDDLNEDGSARPLRSHGLRARALPYIAGTSQSSASGAEATGNQPSTPLTSADPTSSSSNGSPLSGQHGPPNGPHDHHGNEGPHEHHGNEGPHEHHGNEGPHDHHGNEGPHDHEHHGHHGPNALQGNQQGGMPQSQNFATTASTSGSPGSMPGSMPSSASTNPSGSSAPSTPAADPLSRRALQRVRRSNPFGPFGADLD
ncbi:hypothetical protein GGU10DRAFT_359400 [Lentinula aff. detonsa]|uniref:Uncharacterized protein n=1 Tax=Lentinula aff. detonsa TaxID=2804958 RepID=A0AA38L4R7_9AGAR|nr:hypothetical protein GGU10DRAFT_359400 [Lentinula aff. detonsa]